MHRSSLLTYLIFVSPAYIHLRHGLYTVSAYTFISAQARMIPLVMALNNMRDPRVLKFYFIYIGWFFDSNAHKMWLCQLYNDLLSAWNI